jgi:hypothetical protein
VYLGLDPDNLPVSDPSKMDFESGGISGAKAWRDIWGCGQGIGLIDCVKSTADLVDQLEREYETARQALDASIAVTRRWHGPMIHPMSTTDTSTLPPATTDCVPTDFRKVPHD